MKRIDHIRDVKPEWAEAQRIEIEIYFDQDSKGRAKQTQGRAEVRLVGQYWGANKVLASFKWEKEWGRGKDCVRFVDELWEKIKPQLAKKRAA